MPDPIEAPRNAEETVHFLRGTLAALAVVAVHGEETLYREIVATAGEVELAEACENMEDFEWSGLKRYYPHLWPWVSDD